MCEQSPPKHEQDHTSEPQSRHNTKGGQVPRPGSILWDMSPRTTLLCFWLVALGACSSTTVTVVDTDGGTIDTGSTGGSSATTRATGGGGTTTARAGSTGGAAAASAGLAGIGGTVATGGALAGTGGNVATGGLLGMGGASSTVPGGITLVSTVPSCVCPDEPCDKQTDAHEGCAASLSDAASEAATMHYQYCALSPCEDYDTGNIDAYVCWGCW